MVAKAGLGIIGLGAIGIGGVAFAKPEWLGLNKEISWTPLSADHDFSTKSSEDYKSGKFGSKYKYYLVGVVGTKSRAGQENTNKAMWEELFKKWEEVSSNDRAELKKGFKGEIKGGVKVGNGADGNDKYLNTVCQEVYKFEASDVEENGSDSKYKESSVWKYCSPLGEKPKTISDNKETGKYNENNAIGQDATNASKLVSTKGNDKFWEIREKEFRGKPGYDKIEGNGTEDLFFHPTNKKESIRQLCEIAYNKNKNNTSDSTADNPKKDKVLKYCSLDKQ